MHDFDDFDAPDDLADARFGELDATFGDPEVAGLGGATRAAALGASDRARALLAGETGLRFDTLALFAEPLFRHFDLDLADAFALRERPDDADPEIVAMLEAARLLWAFFALPPSERAHRRSALAAHLLGTEPSEDDWIEVEAVLDAAEPYWDAMLPDERTAARQPGKPLLDWDALTTHPSFHLEGDADEAARGYGPDGLSELEARALFAQPLLEVAAANGDGDALEMAMDRAARYWVVARAPVENREDALADALDALADSPAARNDVAVEARRMLARFHELFAER